MRKVPGRWEEAKESSPETLWARLQEASLSSLRQLWVTTWWSLNFVSTQTHSTSQSHEGKQPSTSCHNLYSISFLFNPWTFWYTTSWFPILCLVSLLRFYIHTCISNWDISLCASIIRTFSLSLYQSSQPRAISWIRDTVLWVVSLMHLLWTQKYRKI